MVILHLMLSRLCYGNITFDALKVVYGNIAFDILKVVSLAILALHLRLSRLCHGNILYLIFSMLDHSTITFDALKVVLW